MNFVISIYIGGEKIKLLCVVSRNYSVGKYLSWCLRRGKSKTSKGNQEVCIVVRSCPVLIVNRSDIRRSSFRLNTKSGSPAYSVSSLVLLSLCFTWLRRWRVSTLTFSLYEILKRLSTVEKAVEPLLLKILGFQIVECTSLVIGVVAVGEGWAGC